MRSRRQFQAQSVNQNPGHVPAVAMLALTALVTGAAGIWGKSATQPIAFNHQKHVVELGMECTECHQHAVEGARATIPNSPVCAMCHEEPQTDSSQEARVVKYIQDGEQIPWQIVNWMPDHVYFSHRRHTAIAGIDCEVCHGPIREQSEPLRRPLRHLSMETCIDCHEASGASTDCVSCHK